MPHRLPALLALALTTVGSTGCAKPGKPEVADEPPWETHEGRNEVRVSIAAELIDSGLVEQGLVLIAQLREEGTRDPELDVLQARALMLQGVYSEAIGLLEDTQRRLPRDTRIHKFLAVMYADTGNIDGAVAQLERATKIDPDDASAWNNLGFLLLARQRYPEAVEALREAVALDGTKDKYRNNLGFAFAAVGRYGDALAAFKGTTAPADAHANLALALEMAGNDAEAMDHYRRALAIEPDHDAAVDGVARIRTTRTPVESSP